MFESVATAAVLKKYPLPARPSSHHLSAAAPSIKIATTEREKEEIYRLRYQVYIDEMHGGTRHTEADNRSQQLHDAWDDRAHHFYIEQDGVVAACARVNLRQDGSFECEEHFDMEEFKPSFPNHVCMTSRLVLHPKLRGSHLLKQLTCGMYRFMLERQLRYNFIDCHPQLLPLYSRLGFQLYRPGFNHQKYTYVVPMVLVINDLCHLDRVKSPFVAEARRLGYSSSPAIPVSWSGSQSRRIETPAGMHTDQATDPSCRSDELVYMADAELFEDLTAAEINTLVSLGHVISCRAGDSVLNPGDPGREIFLILSGSFQVQGPALRTSTGEVKVLKILAAGETFGEIRFLRDELRYATVKARENSTLLILNAKALDRLITTGPRIAAKVFRNIARIVSTRLCDGVKFLCLSRSRRRKVHPSLLASEG